MNVLSHDYYIIKAYLNFLKGICRAFKWTKYVLSSVKRSIYLVSKKFCSNMQRIKLRLRCSYLALVGLEQVQWALCKLKNIKNNLLVSHNMNNIGGHQQLKYMVGKQCRY